jgi:integrase
MGTYKRGNVYWYKFAFKGEMIRESTKQGNDKVARNMESAHLARLANQNKEKDAVRERLGCSEVLTCHECEKLFNADKAVMKEQHIFCTTKCAGQWGKARPMPTLKSFLDDRFIPDAETTHKAKPKTIKYYRQGAEMLKRSKLSGLRLDELTSEHVGQFAAEFSRLSPSGINMGLRTLRRALNLAYAWGVIEKPVKVELAKGENQRDRVLSTDELETYLENCPQPWQDAATIIADEGMRPGEVFVLRWEHIFMGEEGDGLIRVVDGKSKAARRILPMTPRVYELLKARHKAQDNPAEGWIFPSQSKHGHLEVQRAKRQHAMALKDSKIPAFVPYVLRHTALTRLGKAARDDVFALTKIAGPSSITITQKYVHPEEETIGEVFSRLAKGVPMPEERVGTKSGTVKKKAAKRLAAGTAK